MNNTVIKDNPITLDTIKQIAVSAGICCERCSSWVPKHLDTPCNKVCNINGAETRGDYFCLKFRDRRAAFKHIKNGLSSRDLQNLGIDDFPNSGYPDNAATAFDELVNSSRITKNQEEKDFEILRLYCSEKNRYYYVVDGVAFLETEFKDLDADVNAYSIDNAMSFGMEIHSFKRLSDNMVFTIGDNVKYQKIAPNNNVWCIASFKIIENSIYGTLAKGQIKSRCNLSIDNGFIVCNKHKLFATHDGVDIFNEDQYVFYVYLNSYDIIGKASIKNCKLEKDKYIFSTREAAEEYVLKNKPCLSVEDVIKAYKNPEPGTKLEDRIKSAAERKIAALKSHDK